MRRAAYIAGVLCAVAVLSAPTKSIEGTLVVAMEAENITLPQKCAQFYNDGSGRWIECMGVGLK